ncbi:type VI secretion system lipoprotein TssJ [Serratia sp. L9]|uniref:type VI secretion system lipoprotein TssJ n=1 Tax=Serratia sp. L9 TaxID=3423946 RepID=UPI003D664002
MAGCGLTQTVKDGTVSAAKSIFYKQIKVLHLDFTARSAMNNNQSGAPLATIVRVYQLKDRQAFDSTDYHSLFAADSQAIKADLLVERDLRITPEGSVSLDMPMEEATQYVAVAAMFWSPDEVNNTWRVVLKREDLEPDQPRQIELNNNALVLKPLKK